MKTESLNKIVSLVDEKKAEFLFDIDGTLHKGGVPYPQKFNPDVVSALGYLTQISKTGASTARSPRELAGFEAKLLATKKAGTVFNSYSVLENGHVIVSPERNIATEYAVLTSGEASAQMAEVIKIFSCSWVKESEEWGKLAYVETPVILPGPEAQGAGHICVYEKGPDVHSPEYHNQYEPVLAWVAGVLASLSLDNLGLSEDGNGTLHVIEKGESKEHRLGLLHEDGQIHLEHVVMFGDGLNDIGSAELVKQLGGVVVAVANAHPNLKAIADIVATENGSDGVLEVLTQMLNRIKMSP